VTNRPALQRSQSGKQDDECSHAENDSRETDRFDDESPSSIKCHAPFLAAVERRR
jgi:hypothetical protein